VPFLVASRLFLNYLPRVTAPWKKRKKKSSDLHVFSLKHAFVTGCDATPSIARRGEQRQRGRGRGEEKNAGTTSAGLG
jgi:hypothetical protein